jgi:hypothetical protein
MPTQMPKKGSAFVDHRLVQGIDHARHGIEAGAAISIGADARQDDAGGFEDDFGGIGHDNVVARSRQRRRLPQGPFSRVEVAGAVIDQRDLCHARVLAGLRAQEKVFRVTGVVLPCGKAG